MTVPSATASEREAKFDVDRDYDPPDFRDLVGRTERLPDQRLRTVYFDTPDRRLVERGISLRYRSTGTDDGSVLDEGWTLKLPDGIENDLLTRSETSWSGGRATIPPQAEAILRGVVRRASLGPVAELDSTRRRLQLIGPDGATVWGELDDDLVSVVAGPAEGAWFRQLEFEVADGGPGEVDAIVNRLRHSGAQPSQRSKVSIALDPAPEVTSRAGGKRRKRQTVCDIATTSIALNLDRLLDRDYRLRLHRDQPDPHDVHQARVATRRLRSDLKLLGAAIDPLWLRHTAQELRWIANALGQVRDLDVLAGNLSNRGDATPECDELLALVRSQRTGAANELFVALDSHRYLDLLDRLHAAVQTPPLRSEVARSDDASTLDGGTAASKALPLLIGQQWRDLERQVVKANRLGTDERLHEVRIRAKRLRYAAETALPVLGKRAEKVAQRAQALQDRLGELRDSSAAEAWLRRQAHEAPLTTAAVFAAGMWAEREHVRQQGLHDRWLASWKRLNRSRNRKWVR